MGTQIFKQKLVDNELTNLINKLHGNFLPPKNFNEYSSTFFRFTPPRDPPRPPPQKKKKKNPTPQHLKNC